MSVLIRVTGIGKEKLERRGKEGKSIKREESFAVEKVEEKKNKNRER